MSQSSSFQDRKRSVPTLWYSLYFAICLLLLIPTWTSAFAFLHPASKPLPFFHSREQPIVYLLQQASSEVEPDVDETIVTETDNEKERTKADKKVNGNTDSQQDHNDDNDDNDGEEDSKFQILYDIRDGVGEAIDDFDPSSIVENIEHFVGGDDNHDNQLTKKKSPRSRSTEKDNSGGIGKRILNLVTSPIGGGDGDKGILLELLDQVREKFYDGDTEEDSSFREFLEMSVQYKDLIAETFQKYLKDVNFSELSPSALFYYLEHEDERKNPSWKRRVHRFCPVVDIEEIEDLNRDLALSRMGYADSVEELQERLDTFVVAKDLVFANVSSEPGKPSHFIAINKNQTSSDELDVTLVVRGTKNIADAVTDLCCDLEDYKDGQAHSFMLQSGKYLADKHLSLLENMLEESGKSTMRLKLIGHSLGAGAAAIAGMELKENDKFEVEVVGYGSPACLSQNLAEDTQSFITSVTCDSDVVPRASGITVANLLLDILESEWLPSARRDVSFALDELQRRRPIVFNDDIKETIFGFIDPILESWANDTASRNTTERLDPILFPPGNCIHFYFDGYGIAGNYVPNTFFGEIDVTRRMIRDHLFVGYEEIFLDLMRQHKDDQHFKFKIVGDKIVPKPSSDLNEDVGEPMSDDLDGHPNDYNGEGKEQEDD